MERKKKKLSIDFPSDVGLDSNDTDTIQNLFSKKFVYSQQSHWSLKSSSVFSKFYHDEETDTVFTQHSHQHSSLIGDCVTCSTENLTNVHLDSEQNKEQSGELENSLRGHTDTASHRQDLFCQETWKAGSKNQNTSISHTQTNSFQPNSKLPPSFTHKAFSAEDSANKGRRKCPQSGRPLRRVAVALPPPWQCDRLLAVKEELNTLKDQLSDKEMISWHQHTNSTNLAGKIVGEIKSAFHTELCTQAWCKFHEILTFQNVLPPWLFNQPQRKFNSIHLCEAPGAFVTSLNHFLIARGFDTTENWQWLGTTLNPYYEGNETGRMISDDRFIRHTVDNWFFGRDDSGDLMSADNMAALMECASFMGDIHLITADGSIDCQENPAEQEVIVSTLHHCEVLCSCLLLAPGGTLVIKLFTMLEASSIALLYFLNCVFEKVTVCKPATSKAGNSEVYAVCSGYTACLTSDGLFNVFSQVAAVANPNAVLLDRQEIPEDFLAEHIECCLYFCKLQSDTISRNLDLYGNVTDVQRHRLSRLQELCLDHYISQCAVQRIENQDRIRPYVHKKFYSRFSNSAGGGRLNKFRFDNSFVPGVGSSSVSFAPGRRQGTFHQRQQQNRSPWQQLLSQIQDYSFEESCSAAIKCRQSYTDEDVKGWKVRMGREFSSVASSLFCDPALLGDLHLVVQNAQVRLHQEKALAQHSLDVLMEAFHLLHSTPLFYHTHHHNQHLQHQNSHNTYHLALEGSVTSFWGADSPELSGVPHRRLSYVLDLQGVERERPVGVVVDVTSPRQGAREEITAQTELLDVMLNVFSYLQIGSCVVLILPVALTRLTSGLLYIFAGLFQETSFAVSKESVFLHQTLSFATLRYTSYGLLRLLETLRHAFSSVRSLARSPESSSSGEQQTPGQSAGDGDDMRIPCSRDTVSVPCHATEGGTDDDSACPSRHHCQCGTSDGNSDKPQNAAKQEGAVSKNIDNLLTVDRRLLQASEMEMCEEKVDSEASARQILLKGKKSPSSTESRSNQSHQPPFNKDSPGLDNTRVTDEGSIEMRMCGKCGKLTPLSNVEDNLQSDTNEGIGKIASSCLGSEERELPAHVKQENEFSAPLDQGSETAAPSGADCEMRAPVNRKCDDSVDKAKLQTAEDVKHEKMCAHSNSETRECKKCAGANSSSVFSLDSLDSMQSHPEPANSSHASLRTKRTRQSLCSAGLCHQQSSAPCEGNVQVNSIPSMQQEVVSVRKLTRQVPLEIVPVLEIINDGIFTRFLQASNRHSVSKFITTVKRQEQIILAKQEQSCLPFSQQ